MVSRNPGSPEEKKKAGSKQAQHNEEASTPNSR